LQKHCNGILICPVSAKIGKKSSKNYFWILKIKYTYILINLRCKGDLYWHLHSGRYSAWWHIYYIKKIFYFFIQRQKFKWIKWKGNICKIYSLSHWLIYFEVLYYNKYIKNYFFGFRYKRISLKFFSLNYLGFSQIFSLTISSFLKILFFEFSHRAEFYFFFFSFSLTFNLLIHI
jgi:hypothetical protein